MVRIAIAIALCALALVVVVPGLIIAGRCEDDRGVNTMVETIRKHIRWEESGSFVTGERYTRKEKGEQND